MIHLVRNDGSGVVARRPGLTAVVAGSDAVSMAESMLASTEDASTSIRALAREVLQRDLTSGALVAEVGHEVEVFAFGPVTVVVDGTPHDAGDEILGLSMRIDAASLGAVVPTGVAAAEAGWERLVTGMVAADGFLASGASFDSPVAAAPAAAAPPEPAPAPEVVEAAPAPPAAEPEVAEPEVNSAVDAPTLTDAEPIAVEPEPTAPSDFRSIDLSVSVDATGSAPLPVEGESDTEPDDDLPAYQRPVQVLGVMSPRGHFNHPEARYCSRTGVKIGASHTRAFVHGERPSLGILSFDDGLTYSVQWNTVIGRDPETDPRVESGEAAPFAVGADELAVSRSHLLVELDEWNVLISDLDTANGTWLRAAGESEPRRLAPGERVVISHGAEVGIGERSFVYHEHHVR